MKLLANRILVERVRRSTLAATGLIVAPPSAENDHNTGGPKEFRVLAIGPGKVNRKGIRIPVECKPGDRVICHSYFTGPTELPNGTHIITDDQIIAVLPLP